MSAASRRAVDDGLDPATAAACAAALERGRAWIMLHRAYYTSALLCLREAWDAEATGTIAVSDDWALIVNPHWAAALTPAQAAAVLCHELHHLLRQHAERRRQRDSARWGLAADLEINDELTADLERSGVELPAEAVTAEAFGLPVQLTAEAYYQLFAEARASRAVAPGAGVAAGGPCGSCADGDDRDGPMGRARASADELHGPHNRASTDIAITRTAQAVKDCGDAPAGLRRWAEERLRPEVDWRRALRRSLRRVSAAAAGRDDFTWRRPSRRAHAAGDDTLLLPGTARAAGRVSLVVDTSGSMSQADLDAALAEIGGIVEASGAPITVYACDAEVAATALGVESAAAVELAGGGGTNMCAGIDAAVAARPRPDAVVVATDGYTPWPERPPQGVPVTVCLIERPEAAGLPPKRRVLPLEALLAAGAS